MVVTLFTAVSCSSQQSADPDPQVSDCTFLSAGNLIPGSGTGVHDTVIWAPDIVSPFAQVKSVAKSQVYSPGGSASTGGDECSDSNFDFPHRDTFCETRSTERLSYNCPKRNIHQGIDINGGTQELCQRLWQAKRAMQNGGAADLANLIPVVAVSDGRITYIGSYTVDLKPATNPGISKFRYLHLNMRTLAVEFGQLVRQGDIIGYYFDDFGGSETTFHLHLELIVVLDGIAQYVSPYASFIQAENRSKNISCQELG